MDKLDKMRIPCFLCGHSIPVKLTKNRKPYFICEQCGLQAFVRCTPGIQRFSELVKSLDKETGSLGHQLECSFEVMTMVARLRDLKAQLNELKNNQTLADYLFTTADVEAAERALTTEIRDIVRRLKQLRRGVGTSQAVLQRC